MARRRLFIDTEDAIGQLEERRVGARQNCDE